VTPNHSIERTSKSLLRKLSAAAHVELQGLPPLSSYKGFPLCQANEVLEPRSGSIHIWTSVVDLQRRRVQARWVDVRAKVRTDKLQPVIDAALLVAERGCGP
jgi:hypothetical protein